MPLVYQQNINEGTTLGVWHITENESFFLEKVSPQQEIRHPHKRLQHLAGRALVDLLYPGFPFEKIIITNSGKPVLDGNSCHFSISHCGNYAAAIVSEKGKVGIDIEIPTQKIDLVRNKFTDDDEIAKLSNLNLSIHDKLTLIWGVKEAVYKWHGEGMVDFKKHIRITGISAHEEKYVTLCNFEKNNKTKLSLSSIMIHGNLLTWIVDKSIFQKRFLFHQ